MSQNTFLCITHSQDGFPVDYVAAHLAEKGIKLVRLDSDRFPLHFELTGEINSELSSKDVTLSVAGETVVLSEIKAIWHRKNATVNLTQSLDGDTLRQATRESEAIKSGLLTSLSQAFWLDHPSNQLDAENKWLQLQLAQKAGLSVPNTLFTNDPQRAKAFYQRCHGQVVVKMHTPLQTSMNRPDQFVYTSKLTSEHLQQLDSLKFSPMIFQQEVVKQAELRVAYVDGQVFAAQVDANVQSGEELLDWRKADARLSRWLPATLPASVISNLKVLMDALDLKFGAIDFIVEPDGIHQFLEVNPAGEWGMLEYELGLPISKAIADTLIRYSLKSV